MVARPLDATDLARLATCHPDLARWVEAFALEMPIRVIEGHRGMADQERAVSEGRSRVHWPNSRHNSMPSEAVDIAPMIPRGEHGWDIPWTDARLWAALGEIGKRVATQLGIVLEWGGDWLSFVDRPHWQLPAQDRR